MSSTPRSALVRGLLGGAAAFAMVNAYLGYAIFTGDWRATRLGFFVNLAVTPIVLVFAYNETRTAWDGRDREVQSSVIALAISAVTLALSFFI